MRYQVHQLKLDNGAEGLVVDIPNAVSVYSMLNFAGGRAALADLKHKDQVPLLLTNLANEVVGYKDNEFYNVLTRNGASLDAYGGNTSVEYSVKCPRFDAERTLDLIAKSLEQPDINASNLAREKKNLTSKLKSLTANGSELIISHTLAHFGYPRLSPQESLTTLDGITPEDIQEYRAQNFTTDNLRFIIAGDFNGDLTVVDRLRQLDLPRGKRFQCNLPTAKSGTQYYFKPYSGAKIILTKVAFALPRPLTLRDELIARLINSLLCGGFDSLVFGEARQNGWAYFVDAEPIINPLNVNLPIITVFRASEENVPHMIQLLADALVKLSQGALTTKRLEIVKQVSIGRESMRYSTASRIANNLSDRYFITGEVVDLTTIPELINSITVSDVQQLTTEILASHLRMVSVFGDTTESVATAAAAKLDAILNGEEK